MTAKVYGTSLYSVLDISETLKELKVSHWVKTKKYHAPPRGAVLVTDGVDLWERPFTNFIVSSAAELSLTNFPRLAGVGLKEDVAAALKQGRATRPQVRVLTHEDYVNWLAKPSVLNLIQTEMYRIQPYSLRKRTQQLILDFFNSRISPRALTRELQSNLKQEGLIPLINQAMYIRDAIARLDKEELGHVSETAGVPTFELLYLTRAGKKC